MKCTTLMTGLIMLCTVCCATAAATAPQLPKYQSWKKSIRKVVTDKKSLFYGIHYIYADSKALKGYKAGNKFPEGSRIVVEHFNIKGDNSTVDGPKNMVVLMKKDKTQKSTGGWLYAGYTADGKPSRLDPVKNCFECHQKEVAGRDYVFSSSADF
ncbi:cytochrome P460 family protein [Trichlorobacter lovleyi]|uniref:cytochrome P460 family protein n=1 Tax=Trichlorobacter lovleyi TaxID=313985 RepID=UPI0023F01DAA|nr:cytochrome P460 family protein [Trichlorobacter lovleyi]